MVEVTGDLWKYPADARCITTNGFVKTNGAAVMGRGCAFQAAQRWPDLPFALGKVLSSIGNQVFVSLIETDGWRLVTFPVKHNWWEKADPELIVRSAHELVAKADEYGWQRIVIPRPGCGNGQLDWADVKPLIETILDDRFHVITY